MVNWWFVDGWCMVHWWLNDVGWMMIVESMLSEWWLIHVDSLMSWWMSWLMMLSGWWIMVDEWVIDGWLMVMNLIIDWWFDLVRLLNFFAEPQFTAKNCQGGSAQSGARISQQLLVGSLVVLLAGRLLGRFAANACDKRFMHQRNDYCTVVECVVVGNSCNRAGKPYCQV